MLCVSIVGAGQQGPEERDTIVITGTRVAKSAVPPPAAANGSFPVTRPDRLPSSSRGFTRMFEDGVAGLSRTFERQQGTHRMLIDDLRSKNPVSGNADFCGIGS
jgi:hypothetical protein